jgi:hypothetical protein
MAVAVALKRLADSGRGVICTVHQPSPLLWAFFTHATVLGKLPSGAGFCAYSGPVGGVVDGVVSSTGCHPPPPAQAFQIGAWNP